MSGPSIAPLFGPARTQTDVESSAESAPAHLTEMDPDGDLLLRVGSELGKPDEFRVCSASMRRASPVWKKMLFGPWKEAKPTDGPWIVDFPDDKPWPIRILLAIVHSRFDLADYPLLSVPELHDILVVADKYDMIAALRPKANSWAGVARFSGYAKLSGQDHVRRIHVAWELGIDELLVQATQDLLFNSSIVQEDTELRVTYNGQLLSFENHAGPGDLVEVVRDLRLSLIQSLLDFYHAEIACRTQAQKFACRQPDPSWLTRETMLCDSVLLGGILRAEKRLNREPMPLKADDVLESANALMGALSGIFSELPCLNKRHESCSPAKKYADFEAKTRADPRWKDVLQPHHKKRMAEQRKKLGLPEPWEYIIASMSKK